jgi:HEAT repeat protein
LHSFHASGRWPRSCWPSWLRELASEGSKPGRAPSGGTSPGAPGATEALPLLRQLAEDRDRDVRATAAQALQSLLETLVSTSGPEIRPVLRELVEERYWAVRQAAAQALGRLGQSEDRRLLCQLAKDPDRGVRQTAVEALVNASGPESLPWLRELASAWPPFLFYITTIV